MIRKTVVRPVGRSMQIRNLALAMTADEAQQRATEIAASLNWPWDAAALSVRSWRVWPFARVWRIESRVAKDGAITWMRLNDRSRAMVFGRVRYTAGGLTAT